MPWPALALGAVSLGGSVVSALGQRDANRQNREMAREQMVFQERMSSTAVQRRMSDLDAAGLNPILAAGSDASTPSGAMGRVENVAAGAEDAVGSAMQALAMKKQLKLLEHQTTKAFYDASSSHSESNIRSIAERMEQAKYGFYFSSNGLPKGTLGEMLQSGHEQTLANSARSVSDSELSRLSIAERKALSDMWTSMGGQAKGLQTFLPLLLSVLRMR